MVSVIATSRFWNIAFRTAHIAVSGMLLGGHFFSVPADRLLPLLYCVILSGAGLGAIELYPDWRGIFHVRSIVIAVKLLLICLVPWLWNYRVSILIVVLVMASVSSHMPHRLRHYSVLERQEVK